MGSIECPELEKVLSHLEITSRAYVPGSPLPQRILAQANANFEGNTHSPIHVRTADDKHAMAEAVPKGLVDYTPIQAQYDLADRSPKPFSPRTAAEGLVDGLSAQTISQANDPATTIFQLRTELTLAAIEEAGTSIRVVEQELRRAISFTTKFVEQALERKIPEERSLSSRLKEVSLLEDGNIQIELLP